MRGTNEMVINIGKQLTNKTATCNKPNECYPRTKARVGPRTRVVSGQRAWGARCPPDKADDFPIEECFGESQFSNNTLQICVL